MICTGPTISSHTTSPSQVEDVDLKGSVTAEVMLHPCKQHSSFATFVRNMALIPEDS